LLRKGAERRPKWDARELRLFTGVKERIGKAWGGKDYRLAFRQSDHQGTKMSAWFNLKMLGSAALALGISTVSLCPEIASANIVFDFNGTCNFPSLGCPTTTDTATAVLTLTDAYVYGANISTATFVSLSYSSSNLTVDLTSADSLQVFGGLNSDGSQNGELAIILLPHGNTFFEAFGTDGFAAGNEEAPNNENGGSTYTFTNVTPPPAVPEPSTWAMMLIGFAGLGYAGRRASRKSAALAA